MASNDNNNNTAPDQDPGFLCREMLVTATDDTIHCCDSCGRQWRGDCTTVTRCTAANEPTECRMMVFCGPNCVDTKTVIYTTESLRLRYLDEGATFTAPYITRTDHNLQDLVFQLQCRLCGSDDCDVAETIVDRPRGVLLPFCCGDCKNAFCSNYFRRAVRAGWLDIAATV